jgi:putative transposase
MHAALLRDGEHAGRDQVARLMGQAGLRGAKPRGEPWRTTISDPTAQKRPDLVQRDFTAPAPDRLWVGDFTYLDALRMALAIRQPGADFTLVSHSDQGSQYLSEDYTQVLDDARVLASVGTVGDAYDNAMAESFVDSFKTELIRDRVWHSNTKLELAIVEYVAWFNTRRTHSSIGNRPPVEHEADWRRLTSQPNTLPSPETLFTLNAAAGGTAPPGPSPMLSS